MEATQLLIGILLVLFYSIQGTRACYYTHDGYYWCVYNLWYFWFGLFWLGVFIFVLIGACVRKHNHRGRVLHNTNVTNVTTAHTVHVGQPQPQAIVIQPQGPPAYGQPSQLPPAYSNTGMYTSAPYPSPQVNQLPMQQTAYPPSAPPAFPPSAPPAYPPGAPPVNDPSYPRAGTFGAAPYS